MSPWTTSLMKVWKRQGTNAGIPWDSIENTPWCFVNGTGVEWEYCNIPYCSDFCQIKGGLMEFSGPVNRTKNNTKCVPWSTTKFINPEDFPKGNEDLRLNYCRNPSNSQTQPWCYTNSNGTTYQHCDIPHCPSTVLFYKENYYPNLEKCLGPETVFSDITSARQRYQQLCLTTEELSLTILCSTNNHSFAAIQIECDLCPDLPVFASVSLQTGVYKVGTSWTYTCAEGRYPVSGSGTYKCEFTKEWLAPNPGLICKNWTNYAYGATLNKVSTLLTDDDINTCTDFPSYTYRLQMTTALEVRIVTFILNQTQAFSGRVTVTSANMTKACSNVTVYDLLVVVTCEQAPVTQNLTLEVSAGAVLHLCEWRVFGRPPSLDGDFHFLECLQSETGSEYKGDVSFTSSGVTCLRWDSVTGTSALYFPDWNITEVANKCRNPGDPGNPRQTSPWCYVNTTSGREAQLCFIPKCSNWCDVPDGTTEYNGDVRRPCSKWTDVLANQTVRLFRGEDFPDRSTNHNFCRNPNNSPTGPWCYTDLNGTSQSCSVPHCPTALVSLNESDPLFDTVTSCFLETGVEANYSHVRASARARCFTLSVLYVTVLCKTNTSHLAAVQIECDYCPPLPTTSGLVVDQRNYPPGTNVSFTCSDTRVTVGGRGTLLCSLSLQWEVVSHDLQCKDWPNYGQMMVNSANDSQRADSNVTTCVTLPAGWYDLTLSGTLEVAVVTFRFKENVFPLDVTVAMTANSGQKACTALSNDTGSVFRCQQGPVGNKVQVQLPTCTLCKWGVYGRTLSSGASKALQCLQSPAGVEYKGDINFTVSGRECLRWDAKQLANPSPDDLPDSSVAEAGNKCRNPVSRLKDRPWCYVDGGGQDWEYCCIPSCEATCWIQNGVTSYYGDVSVASNNQPCVSWKKALANEAVTSLWPWDFPDLSTDHNFCRNPNNSRTGPWCYTDLNGTSQSCSVPQCPTQLLAYYDDPYRLSVKWCYIAEGVATLQHVLTVYQSTCLTTHLPFLTALCATNTSFIAVRIPCELPSSWSSNEMSSAASTIFSDHASTPFHVTSSSSLVGEHTVMPSSALSYVTRRPSTQPAVGYTATSTLDYTSIVKTSTNSLHFDPITSVTTMSYSAPGSTWKSILPTTTPIFSMAATSSLTHADTRATTTAYTSTPVTTIMSTPTTAATSTPITSATSTPSSAATSTPTSAATSTSSSAATSTSSSAATSTSTSAATSTSSSAATSSVTRTTPSAESFGRRQAMCPCDCLRRSMMKNMSEVQVQVLVVQQQKELTVDKYVLSSTRRLKACEPNHDIYAVATGSVLGVTALAVVVLFFMMGDLLVFSSFLRRVCRRWWQRWRRR
ncbi:uncharacterized protein LOC112555197 [Pomacea canaliculata]|uniref:uncharacterized protein LOC112555197 n=1 Tax=Pomacea canaliculata TaxID=400727 RepID=UPI000D73F704|nr:uncharacterized protein LOC112555197 [Pomacea canaliculata]